MSGEEDLINALTESLDQTGALDKLKARIRAEVLTVLNNKKDDGGKLNKPIMNYDILLVNELIREYLNWLDYKSTSSMLITESGMSDTPMSRSVLMKELNVKDKGSSSHLPVLLSLVSTFKNIPSIVG